MLVVILNDFLLCFLKIMARCVSLICIFSGVLLLGARGLELTDQTASGRVPLGVWNKSLWLARGCG